VKSAPTTKLASLSIVPLAPVDPEVAEQYKLQSPRKSYATAALGTPDVLEGDILTVGGVAYAVRVVSAITAPVAMVYLIVEQVK
jgi:hypothetical protein